MEAYATGILAIVALAVGWLGVQRAWARSFPNAFDDPDVLARRRGCDGCGCLTPCGRELSPSERTRSEERRV
jgi:hypothetical protein